MNIDKYFHKDKNMVIVVQNAFHKRNGLYFKLLDKYIPQWYSILARLEKRENSKEFTEEQRVFADQLINDELCWVDNIKFAHKPECKYEAGLIYYRTDEIIQPYHFATTEEIFYSDYKPIPRDKCERVNNKFEQNYNHEKQRFIN